MASIRQVIKGNVFVLMLGTIMRQLSLFITFPYFSLYVIALGGSKVDIGIVNSLRPFAAMLIYPIAGAIAESYSRVRVLVVAELVNAVTIVVYMLAPDWRFLAAANFFNGLLVFRFPTSSALLADSMDPDFLGSGYAAFNSIPAFIGIFSPFIGGYLVDTLGITYAMRVLYGVTFVALSLVTFLDWRFLEETLPKPYAERSDLSRILLSSFRQVLDTLKWLPKELRFYALLICFCVFFNSITSLYWVVYATDVLGISEFNWGTILTITLIIQVALSFPAGNIIDRYPKHRVAAFAMALSALPTIFFPFATGFLGVLLSLIPISVANAFLIPVAGALMVDLTPVDRRGMTMATLGRGWLLVSYRGEIGGGPGIGFLICLPLIIGSVLGGYIYDTNPIAPWILMGSALAVNSILAIHFLKLNSK